MTPFGPQPKNGSEAIVEQRQNGKTVYVLREMNENDTRSLARDFNPNIVKFSLDLAPGKTDGAERILPANALSSRNALDKGLKAILPAGVADRPEVKIFWPPAWVLKILMRFTTNWPSFRQTSENNLLPF